MWVVLGLGVAACAVAAWYVAPLISVRDIVGRVRDFGALPFFTALAVLPAFGMPVVPFYLVAGAFGLPTALIGSIAAIIFDLALCYALARWILHPLAARVVAKLGYRIPVVRPEDRWMVTLLLRVTPGPPFFVQNYLLILAGVPFRVFMLVSIPVCTAYTIGFVVAGESLMTGRGGQLVLGIGLVVAALVGLRFVRRALQRRAARIAAPVAAAAPSDGAPPA